MKPINQVYGFNPIRPTLVSINVKRNIGYAPNGLNNFPVIIPPQLYFNDLKLLSILQLFTNDFWSINPNGVRCYRHF